jgi:hypothetical protein
MRQLFVNIYKNGEFGKSHDSLIKAKKAADGTLQINKVAAIVELTMNDQDEVMNVDVIK